MSRIGKRISRIFGGSSSSSVNSNGSSRRASFTSQGTAPPQPGNLGSLPMPSSTPESEVGLLASLAARIALPWAHVADETAPSPSTDDQLPTINVQAASSTSLPAQSSDSPAPSVSPAPTSTDELRAIASLGIQCTLSLAQVAAELAPIPCIGPLVGCLTAVFQAVERSRVNKEQWKLLQGRCVMVMRIAGARVMNNGQRHYPGLQEAAQQLKRTLDKIQERAQHYSKMNSTHAFLLYQIISDEIQGLFGELDSCLVLFSFATDVAREQWVAEFRIVQERELSELGHLKNQLGKIDLDIDVIGRNSQQILVNTDKIADALQQVLDEKSSVLQAQSESTTTVSTLLDAQRLIRTILAVTKLQLPPKLLLGRQCILDASAPIKTGITCDVYLASFLGGGEKVAKKVFRIGMSDKEFVEKYATRFLRIASLWSDLRSDYTLPFYGIGMESFEQNSHFQLYMVSPLMKNYDAMTYLKEYRNNAGMKKNILRIVTDAAKGLQYLHNRSPPVVHSGMRGDNILITDSGGAVLGGFGLTKALENYENSELPPAVMTGKTESQRWLAPEMFVDEPTLTPPCDVWGWAMATLEIVSGSLPYCKQKQAMNIILTVKAGPPKRKDYPAFNTYAYRPDDMWALLEKCWAMEPGKRPTMDGVVTKLKEIARMPEAGA